ncbi:hypothetical protein TERTU_1787 [Teredinibacter turnerae T7901]|uniref:Serine aminopeptidase S33 domain-containing protein n=1 Tax=Teredinibacter turnerae (strain ATCC 39867 / T7901) TaxID=377629 RepID=C5BHR3_TERTT|nr:alpha/beta fold hydrolase [Teredinibacter turnerae]ACR14525.1 hypothetical protein TERTU_1787 [Teredinibacter turnerae T7901]
MINNIKNIIFVIFISISLISKAYGSEILVVDHKKERELQTCNNEKTLFWALSVAAGLTPYKKVSKLRGGEKLKYKTSDGVELSGIKLSSETKTNTYILLIQGNGFPAGRLIQEFERFRDKGIDVYAFDFRGYKKSQGKRRIWAMLQDYSEILDWLNSNYSKRIIYATSYGGVIASNVISDYSLYDLVFFDSVISRASYVVECSKNYDPVEKLPNVCGSLIVQANDKDRFYTGGLLGELMEAATDCGGKHVVQPGLAHPFEEKADQISTRMKKLEELIVPLL